MSHTGTTGLAVSHNVIVHRLRRLPVPGEVLIERGARVSPATVVARAEIPGPARVVPIAQTLGVPAERTAACMAVAINGTVREGDLLARRSTLWGWLTSEVRAPVAGTVESLSRVTGQLVLRAPPQRVEVAAYLDGVVTQVLPREGVVVSARAALIQGIFGVGGETWGRLSVLNDGSPTPCDGAHPRGLPASQDSAAQGIGPGNRGDIVIVPGRISAETIQAALSAGASALIGASIHDDDLCDWLGCELVGGVTGGEKGGLTLIVTEGFGDLRMSQQTFALLSDLNGRMASVNGATQIRAGVLRPEILVSHPAGQACESAREALLAELAEAAQSAMTDEAAPAAALVAGERMAVGARVRLIRSPRFGAEGAVVELPPPPEKLLTEAIVRVAVVRLTDGTLVRTPRANVEVVDGGPTS